MIDLRSLNFVPSVDQEIQGDFITNLVVGHVVEKVGGIRSHETGSGIQQ